MDSLQRVFDKEYSLSWEIFDTISCNSHFAQLQTVKIYWGIDYDLDKDEIQDAFKEKLPMLYRQGVLSTQIYHESKYIY